MELVQVQYQVKGRVGWISMCSPWNRNAIDEGMAQALLQALAQCENDPAVRVIVLTGEGKSFSSGGDIGYFSRRMTEGASVELSALARLVGELALSLRKCRKLVITLVNGAAAGAGANLALNGDFVLCGEDTVFLQAFLSLGLVPDTGGGYLLPRTIGPQRTMEYCVLNRPMTAAEAKQLGLIHQVVPRDELIAAGEALAARLADGPTAAYAGLKQQIFSSCFSDYEAYLKNVEGPTQNACAATEDFQEGIRAFMERRRPKFQGR